MRRFSIHGWLSGHRADHGDADPLPFLRPFRPPQEDRAEPGLATHKGLAGSLRVPQRSGLGAVVAGLAVLMVIAATLAYLIVTAAAR
jgi:hypothetical protein